MLILLAAGIFLTIIAAFIDLYAGGIVFILFAAVAMSFFIMQETKTLPDIVIELKEDAKGIIIRNSGNSDAVDVHVAIVPHNMEYDIPILAPDQIREYLFGSMIAEAKAVATFKNIAGDAFSRSYEISARGSNDPLKPMIPLFRYK